MMKNDEKEGDEKVSLRKKLRKNYLRSSPDRKSWIGQKLFSDQSKHSCSIRILGFQHFLDLKFSIFCDPEWLKFVVVIINCFGFHFRSSFKWKVGKKGREKG